MGENKLRNKIFNFAYMLIGTALIAISINSFFLRLKIAPGGVSGLATVLHYLTNFPMGNIVFLLNIPLFIVGFLTFGKKFSIKTLIATFFLSFFLDISIFLPQITQDKFISSIFGGIIMGSGMALVFRGGATTGGTDIAAKVVNKYAPLFNISEQLFIIDGIVVIFAMFVFKDFDIGFYSIIAIWIATKTIDIVFEGAGFAKAMFIISNNGEKIGNRILQEVGRGVTVLNGEGLYLKSNKKILLSVVDRINIPIIKKIAKEEDEKSFIIITDVREALGEGFNRI